MIWSDYMTVEEEKQIVKDVYTKIAGEYDTRIPGRECPADHKFSATEMKFILDRVSPRDSVLDIGCGTGRFTIPMAEKVSHIVGFDMSEAMLTQAQNKAKKAGVDSKITFQRGDAEKLPFESETFDVVTSMLALMHMPVEIRPAVFAEASRVLKPGGRMLIGVKNGIFERLSHADRFASIDIADVDQKKLIFTDTQIGEVLEAPWYSFTPQELDKLFWMVGMKITYTRGNIPFLALLSDDVAAHGKWLTETLGALEDIVGDVPPFNYFGYYLLVEAVKPLTSSRRDR
jgi:ubiquinone/menaquinone biosynthesis C-methylase UbiE